MSFLKAEWRKLAMANYAIDPDIMIKYVPKGTELDLWNGKCYVSLVGFMFLNTRLLGLKIPFHVNFEEVNLRFYVKRFENGSWKRGVVFIKEIVPKPALSFVANTVYRENYQTMPMRHKWHSGGGRQVVEYHWRKDRKWNSISVTTDAESHPIEPDSEAEFITEHYWGYARVGIKKTNEYEVTHPVWEVYKVHDFEVDVDFESVYGADFGHLKLNEPASVMLAEGSEITVEFKKSIKSDTGWLK